MRRLYIDFDGVVMDTIPLLYKEFEDHGVDLSEEIQVSDFLTTYDFRKVIKDENILNDSIKCIKKLYDSNKFEIAFLTHVYSVKEGVVKINYLRNYFKDTTIIIVPKEVSKTKMVHTEGAILVDDYAGNLNEWKENGGIPIRFSKTLESHGFKVINKLDKLIDLFEENGDEIC